MIDDRERNPKPIEEGVMYNSTTSRQLGIFGDGWIYRTVLRETGNHPLVHTDAVHKDETLNRRDIKSE